MKSQKGITAISLVVYVVSFSIIAVIVGTLTNYFYSNIQILDSSVSSSSEYNKFNLYMLNETKKKGNTVEVVSDDTAENDEGNSIIFISSDGQTKNSFKKLGNILYYNKIKLCEDVNEFKIKSDKSTGKATVTVLLTIGNNSYSTEYVID